jgi:phosphate acetyltransferase
MRGVLERIQTEARARPRRLVLVEGEDERVVGAAAHLASEGLARVTLLCDPAVARATAARAGVGLDGVAVEDAGDGPEIERASSALRSARANKLPPHDLDRLARDPLLQAAARVSSGAADCTVAGAVRTTADVVQAALWLIGMAEGVKSVSSFFLMVVPPVGESPERVLAFTDCGVVPDPDSDQLAETACLAAERFERLSGETARTAFLSFSTRGSARHPRVNKVREAVEKARARRPAGLFDGELQADAALDPGVARRKAPDSAVAGRANVLVFPDLDAGNIGYKLVQRLAGADAYGPILQGLRRQANDLSRGCSRDDVVHVATIACVLSTQNGSA